MTIMKVAVHKIQGLPAQNAILPIIEFQQQKQVVLNVFVMTIILIMDQTNFVKNVQFIGNYQ